MQYISMELRWVNALPQLLYWFEQGDDVQRAFALRELEKMATVADEYIYPSPPPESDD